MPLSRGLRLHQYLDDWLIRSQSQEEAQVNTQAVVYLTQSLGWIINQKKIRTKAYSGFFFVRGLRIPSRFSPCNTHSREMTQTSGFDLTTEVKHVLTARCLMSLIGLLASTEKMVTEGRLYMRPFQISSVAGQPPSLDRSHCSPHRLVAKSHKRDERRRPSSQRPQHPTFYRRLKRRLGRSLRTNLYKGSVVRQRKKATHKCSRVEGGLSGPSKLPRTSVRTKRCWLQRTTQQW